MWSTRVRRALAWTLGATLALVPAAASAPPDDPSSTLTEQLATTSLAPGTRAMLLAAADGLHLHHARFSAEGVTPVELQLWLKPASAERSQRIVDATINALRVFSTWYGSFPYPRLVVIDAAWRSPLIGASYPGAIVIGTRWIAPPRDMTVERSLVGAIARQYLFAAAARTADATWFDEAVVLYSGTRAVHEALENSDPATVRFFDGHVPVVIRPVELSPNRADPRPRVRHFVEIDEPSTAPWRSASAAPGQRTQQGALALHTLERYVGWPAMQEALAGYRRQAMTSGGSPATFAAVIGEQRGRDLSWFFDEAFRVGSTFDYAVDNLTSDPMSDGSGRFRTMLSLRRFGNAVFSGSSEAPVGGFTAGRALPVSVSFADGSVADDFLDGRASQNELEYLSRSPAVSASVDPRAVLVIDRDRANNTRTPRPVFHPVGARLALHWMVWLQDLMLTYSSLA